MPARVAVDDLGTVVRDCGRGEVLRPDEEDGHVCVNQVLQNDLRHSIGHREVVHLVHNFKSIYRLMGVSENWGTLFWGPYNTDPTI